MSPAPLTLGLDIGGTSAKAALFAHGAFLWTGASARYAHPDQQSLLAAIDHLARAARAAAASLPITAVGLCAPGLRAPDGNSISAALNLPAIVGLDLPTLARRAAHNPAARVLLTTDAHAAAFDIFQSSSRPPRLLALSLGTGVGACVLDHGVPLRVSADSPGHLGQIDVSIHEPGRPPPTGPDGGRGSLEAYIGLPALLHRFGPDPHAALAALKPTDAPILALVRALRIAHAIYRPDQIWLLGGIGIRLHHLAPHIDAAVRDHLTSLARPHWTLHLGTTDHHAARGAALLAS